MREVMGVLGGVAAMVIVLTLLGRGGFSLGTSQLQGPYLNFNYTGR